MKRQHEYKIIVLDEKGLPSHVLTQEEIIKDIVEQDKKHEGKK
jgi:hypothetical protein